MLGTSKFFDTLFSSSFLPNKNELRVFEKTLYLQDSKVVPFKLLLLEMDLIVIAFGCFWIFWSNKNFLTPLFKSLSQSGIQKISMFSLLNAPGFTLSGHRVVVLLRNAVAALAFSWETATRYRLGLFSRFSKVNRGQGSSLFRAQDGGSPEKVSTATISTGTVLWLKYSKKSKGQKNTRLF